jgi:hypothetical protein
MFHLPPSTKVQKVVPKNAFDNYTNSKQKKAFADNVLRITWANKIATDTVNLQRNDIQEIQVFKIELKEKLFIKEILSIIDKAIPYPIIFWIEFQDEFYISTAAKHPNPKDENQAVIDYVFTTDWKLKEENPYQISLKNNIDWVFKNFCEQLKDNQVKTKTLTELVSTHKEKENLDKKITRLQSEIYKCRQFNKKVELNIKLKALEEKREL